MNRLRVYLFTLLTLAGLGGCQVNPFAQSTLSITTPRGESLSSIHFDTAVYGFDQQNHLTVVLLEGPADAPISAATIRMFWRPKTGSTPIDKTATNATIRYILFAYDDQDTAAVYSGAGFLNPHTARGDDRFQGDLWQANLRLSDAPEGFVDPIGISKIAGPISAKRNDIQTHRLLRQLQQRISERLGYPRLVKAQNLSR